MRVNGAVSFLADGIKKRGNCDTRRNNRCGRQGQGALAAPLLAPAKRARVSRTFSRKWQKNSGLKTGKDFLEKKRGMKISSARRDHPSGNAAMEKLRRPGGRKEKWLEAGKKTGAGDQPRQGAYYRFS